MLIDAAVGSALMGKAIEAAKAPSEGIASNNCYWSGERTILKRSSTKYDIDAMDMLVSKVDALTQKFDRLGTSTPGGSSGMMYKASVLCEVYDIKGHMATDCHTNFQGVEHANALQNFNICLQNNPYSNTYNPG